MTDDERRAFYDEHGYVLIEDAVSPEALQAMRAVTHEFIERSRAVTESDDVYDLDEGHGPDAPRLTRIKLPHRQHEVFAGVLRSEGMKAHFRSFLGPDVVLQTSKLNTKAPGGGAAVEWHQDWAFYPHTNDDMLAFGIMLEDVGEEHGPLMVIPGSHRGPVLSHHANGVFCGAVDPDDPDFHPDRAVALTGRAGSMSVHHARTLHGSAPNRSDRARLILFFEACAADAWPLLGAGSYIHRLGQQAMWDDLQERMICGAPVLEPRVERVPVRLPLPPAPDASSIFRSQRTGGARSAFAA